jgi:ADP-ribose pyrophosphatase
MSEVCNVSKFGVVPEYPERLEVPDEQVSWDVQVYDYNPPYYISPGVQARGGRLTDFESIRRVRNFAESATGPLRFDERGRPLNPLGRTGIAGMGVMWYYGPSVASDIFEVRGEGSDLEITTGLRKDNGKRAITGGFQDRIRVGKRLTLNGIREKQIKKGGRWQFEGPLETAVREHMEEVSIDLSSSIAELNPVLIYAGIVRNSLRQTDHAWIETNVFAVNVNGTRFADMTPVAGDDLVEGSAEWSKVSELDLDAMHDDHGKYVQKYLELRAVA